MAFRRESPIRGRRLSFGEAVMEKIAMSPVGYQMAVHVAPHVDKRLIPATGGRFSTFGVGKVALVTSVGAKSGQERVHPLTVVDEGDALLAIGSNYGRPEHPAWSANLKANPECTVEFKGPPRRYRAELLSGEERAAAWAAANDLYAGYESYAVRCAPREIRVFRLRPIAE